MKICLLCYRGNPYSGGQGIYLKYIAEELVRQGHTVHAVVGPPMPPELEGVTVHYIPNNEYFIKNSKSSINTASPFDIFRPGNLFEFASSRVGSFPEISAFSYRAYQLLRKLQKEHNFDIIHDNQCLGYGMLLMKSLGIPVIATIHHPLTIDLKVTLESRRTFLHKSTAVMFYPILMQQFVSKRLDHIITVSEDSKMRINNDFGVPMEKQTVIYNGLDTSIFRPIKKIQKKKGKILFVGNVEDGKKGFPYLLKAMSRVPDNVRLTVVDGGAPHRKVTKRIIRKLNLENRIEFVGTVNTEQLIRQYNESEIAIVPSVYEGFGFPAAEAMACETPVITSTGGALPEVVGDTGIIVPERDEEALAHAITSLIKDKKKLAKMGKTGKQRVLEHFNWKIAVEKIVQVYMNAAG